MMRAILLGGMVVALVLAIVAEPTAAESAATQGPRAEAELQDLEQRLAQAWVTGDRAFIEGLLAVDWTVTDPSGHILTRDQVLTETFTSTERKIERMVVDDVRVRLLGTTAVVTGRTRATGSYRGQSGTAVLRFTDVFAYRDGRWQIVASQGTTIPP